MNVLQALAVARYFHPLPGCAKLICLIISIIRFLCLALMFFCHAGNEFVWLALFLITQLSPNTLLMTAGTLRVRRVWV